MTSRDFVYWLQGYFEILDSNKNEQFKGLTECQAECVRRHLNLVFVHEIDPSMGDQKHQDNLNYIHSPGGEKPEPGPGGEIHRC